jgi:hypothetical protein
MPLEATWLDLHEQIHGLIPTRANEQIPSSGLCKLQVRDQRIRCPELSSGAQRPAAGVAQQDPVLEVARDHAASACVEGCCDGRRLRTRDP